MSASTVSVTSIADLLDSLFLFGNSTSRSLVYVVQSVNCVRIIMKWNSQERMYVPFLTHHRCLLLHLGIG